MKKFFLPFVFGLFAALAMPGLAWAAKSCGPALNQGTAPADFRDYCWLDFSEYVDATALTAGGQPLTFNLPDRSVVTMTVKTSRVVGATTNAAIVTKAVPSYTDAAFGTVAFSNIPGSPILYTNQNAGGSTIKVELKNIVVTAPSGGTADYSIVVGDGETTNNNETLSFTTNAGNWVSAATAANGGTFPTVTGEDTQTVTLTGTSVNSGKVGSYVFRSANNPKNISATLKGNGLQGIIVGVRYASIAVRSKIVGSRYNAADQFTYGVSTSAGSLMSGATTGAVLVGDFAVVPTIAASYPFTISQAMASGSTGALANYSVSLTCVNAAAGSLTPMPTNELVSVRTILSLKYGDSVTCTFSNTPIFSPVTGTVYSDANHNFSQDGAESGTGVANLFVKLATSTNGVCQNPASAAAAVTPSTGAYSLPAVPPGRYCLILDDNNSLSDITSTPPEGWLGTQNGTGVSQIVVESAPPEVPINFGLFNGYKLSGTVFADTGVGSGAANNGSKDGTEPGIASVTVNALSGSTAAASASTAGDGSYTLWVAATVTGTGTVTIQPSAPSGYAATGGAVGSPTAGASYSRPSVINFTPVAGKTYTGVNFGLVPANTLAPNGAETGQPGTVVFYAHTFTAGSGGDVTFSLANAATPTGLPWSQVLYRDSDCSSLLDGSEPQVIGAITVTAGQTLCLIVKQFIPLAAAMGAKNMITLSAAFSYTNSSPLLTSTLTANDVTTVGLRSALALNKLVKNVTLNSAAATTVVANPGNVLEYILKAQNNGSEPLTTLVINDATPAFTTYVSAACPGAFPTGISACSVTTPTINAPGDLQWTFTGSLMPSAQLSVTYQVKVNQ